jgi:hypothetical protein
MALGQLTQGFFKKTSNLHVAMFAHVHPCVNYEMK